jgi:hypothetical protein
MMPKTHEEAFDRIPLFRLAWDASISAFAGRQVLYERVSFGNPYRARIGPYRMPICAPALDSPIIPAGRDRAPALDS